MGYRSLREFFMSARRCRLMLSAQAARRAAFEVELDLAAW